MVFSTFFDIFLYKVSLGEDHLLLVGHSTISPAKFTIRMKFAETI